MVAGAAGCGERDSARSGSHEVRHAACDRVDARRYIMRILTFTRLVGLAAIGGAVYVHRQRGGDWSMASIKDTLHHLLTTGASKLETAAHEARRAQPAGAGGANQPQPRSRISDDKSRSY